LNQEAAVATPSEVADFIDRQWGPVPICPGDMLERILDRICNEAKGKFGADYDAGKREWDQRVSNRAKL
jgi:hypothetical protein